MCIDLLQKKWIEIYDQSVSAEDRYKPSKQIRFKTSKLRSDLCNFNDPYIVVKITITVTDPNDDAYGKKLAFKNNALFLFCLTFQKLIIHSLIMLKTWIF